MTLVDILREQASGYGDRRAFTFLEDGSVETNEFTYAGLDERARAVAARLQTMSRAGERGAACSSRPGWSFSTGSSVVYTPP